MSMRLAVPSLWAYWAKPRGTMDVDLTLFLPHEKASEMRLRYLEEIGCDVQATRGSCLCSREHGFCRVTFGMVSSRCVCPIDRRFTIVRRHGDRTN